MELAIVLIIVLSVAGFALKSVWLIGAVLFIFAIPFASAVLAGLLLAAEYAIDYFTKKS